MYISFFFFFKKKKILHLPTLRCPSILVDICMYVCMYAFFVLNLFLGGGRYA